jgi:tripartite-type tricarboxylate transporter receptor subunit TctC
MNRSAISPSLLLWLLCMTPAAAKVQKWPTKPVRIYVGFTAGTSTDVVARIVANAVSPRIGQPIVVENRPGASGTIAASLGAKAAPDGYSMVLGTPSSHATAPHVFLNLPYDPIKDFAPVALIGNSYYVLVVAPQTAVKNVKELVALARSKPGQLNYASVGEGSLAHLGALIFSDMTGIQSTHVPYKGSTQSILDIVAGRVQFVFTVISTAQPLHRDGRVRIIAVAGPRQGVLPDVPSMAESGYPDYELYFWFATFVPAATPRAIVSRMNREVNASLIDPKTRNLLIDAGVTPNMLTLEELGELMRKDAERFRKIVVKAGIKPQPL